MEKQLDKGDLFLLMESYKNMIELNRTLLEQQKQMITQINSLVESQKNLCDNIVRVLNDSNMKFGEIERDLTEIISSNKELIKNVNEKMILSSKTNSDLNNKLNMMWLGFSAIIIPMIALVLKAFEKFDMLNKIYELVQK
ncbi:MAG: hypothetical protein BWY04_01073 [candidate division CPR1 bacterium ADurb.Bin160]|uniref:Uncharacterized protein n=1 Tax=candidate division CPR1 bacterium ADurb.Bin160 TaxID=1852826 RepID=A0A1V5ZLH8_9BACT|nr:MAG: hypothetical protein BWY04_01073 [candidate division CPR1 bacterium ADurb.Bin160]